MWNKYGYAAGFIISMFFLILLLATSINGVLDFTSTYEMVQENPLFSWINPMIAYLIHIFGNIFFAVLAGFLALDCWREYMD